MTTFKRDDFEYSGGYLMFHGDAGKYQEYYGDGENVHPTRRNKPKAMFVARFKYSSRDKARFLTFLIKNFTVEEFFNAVNTPNPCNPWNNPFSPAPVLEAKGYISATVRSGMKAKGYTVFTRETYRDYFQNHVSTSGDCTEFFAEKDKEYAAILEACKNA